MIDRAPGREDRDSSPNQKAVWSLVSGLLPAPPKRLLRLVISLVVIAGLAFVGTWILKLFALNENTDSLSSSEISNLVSGRLHSIATSLDSTREWLATDSRIRHGIETRAVGELFRILSQRDSQFAYRPVAFELYSGGLHGKQRSSS